MLKVGDAVKALSDHKEEGVDRGDVGTVAFCFTEPSEGYEVEFLDEDGYTKAVLTLEPSDYEPVQMV